MADMYITQAGDQWDLIAKKVYGDETYMSYLIDNNLQYIDVFEFSAGIALYTPPLQEENINDLLPPWRQ